MGLDLLPALPVPTAPLGHPCHQKKEAINLFLGITQGQTQRRDAMRWEQPNAQGGPRTACICFFVYCFLPIQVFN